MLPSVGYFENLPSMQNLSLILLLKAHGIDRFRCAGLSVLCFSFGLFKFVVSTAIIYMGPVRCFSVTIWLHEICQSVVIV